MYKYVLLMTLELGTLTVAGHEWKRNWIKKYWLLLHFQHYDHFPCLHTTIICIEYCTSQKQDCLLLMSVYSGVNDYQQVVSHTLMWKRNYFKALGPAVSWFLPPYKESLHGFPLVLGKTVFEELFVVNKLAELTLNALLLFKPCCHDGMNVLPRSDGI